MFYFGTSLGVKLPWVHVHKTRSWYLLGVTLKTSDEHPRHFYRGVPLASLRRFQPTCDFDAIENSIPRIWRGSDTDFSISLNSKIYMQSTLCWRQLLLGDHLR